MQLPMYVIHLHSLHTELKPKLTKSPFPLIATKKARKIYGSKAWERPSIRLVRISENFDRVLSESQFTESDQLVQLESPVRMSGTSNPPTIDPEIVRAVNYVIMGRPFLEHMKEILKEIRDEENATRQDRTVQAEGEPEHPPEQANPNAGGGNPNVTL